MAKTQEEISKHDFSHENSTYESGSESDEENSSSEDEVMVKPVFLSKTQRTKKNTIKREEIKSVKDNITPENSQRSREIALEKAENLGSQVINVDANDDIFGGVNDDDDLDPEQEYTEWRARERKRYDRDTEALRNEERAHEEKVRRGNMSEQQLQHEFTERQSQRNKDNDDNDFRKGVFFNG